MHVGFTWIAVAAAAVVIAWPTAARACSCAHTGPGRLYLGAGGTLPADAAGIPWSGPVPLTAETDPPRPIHDRVKLERHDGPRKRDVPLAVVERDGIALINPKQGRFKPGEVYTVTVWPFPGRAPDKRAGPPPAPLIATVTITADAPALQDVAVRLSAREQRRIPHANLNPGMCGGMLDADTLDLSTALPPALEPYRDYLLYETLIDDKPWTSRQSMCQDIPTGRSWIGSPGIDLLFSECGEPIGGLTPGTHTVALIVRTPDGARNFTTPAQSFAIGCAGEPTPEPATAPAPAPREPAREAPPPAATPRGCSLAAPPSPWLLAPLLLLRPRRRRAA